MIINNFNASTNINAYEKYDKTYHLFIILRFHLLSAEKLPTVDYKSIAGRNHKGCSKKNDQARAIYSLSDTKYSL